MNCSNFLVEEMCPHAAAKKLMILTTIRPSAFGCTR